MNTTQIAEILEEDVRKGYGEKLTSDIKEFLSGVSPDYLIDIAQNVEKRLTDWAIEARVNDTDSGLVLQKRVLNQADDGALFCIEVTTAGSARLWQQNSFQNLDGNEIQFFAMLGTSSKDVSRMLQSFRPPVRNPEFELKEGMQGILALTVESEKPQSLDHFEQLNVINAWCVPNNFCITALKKHDFWSEVKHDPAKFVDSVIAMVDKENAIGVVISSTSLLEEILPDFCNQLIAQLRERGKSLYASDAGENEIEMTPQKEFALRQENLRSVEAESVEPEPDHDPNSVLEQMRVGIDQLDYVQAGYHAYPISINGTQIQVIEIKEQKGSYCLELLFYGPDGRAWSKCHAHGAWEFIVSSCKKYFEQYESTWNARRPWFKPNQQ